MNRGAIRDGIGSFVVAMALLGDFFIGFALMGVLLGLLLLFF